MNYFSRQTDYAIQLVSALAKLPGGNLLSLKIFSIESSISFLFLQKIAQSLKKAKIIASARGKRGGYRLARPAESITVRQIMEAAEGRTGMVDCQTIEHQQCSKLKKCAIRCPMDKLNEKMLAVLDGATIADF
ncbi:MAG: Rrf2 family transcriptional regulator [Patescibacteria group bacterium]